MKIGKDKSGCGFTIFEILVAITLVSVIVVFFSSLTSELLQKKESAADKFKNFFSEVIFFCRLKSINAQDSVKLQFKNQDFLITYYEYDPVSKTQTNNGSSYKERTVKKPFSDHSISNVRFFTYKKSIYSGLGGDDVEIKDGAIFFKNKFCIPFRLLFTCHESGTQANYVISVNQFLKLEMARR